MRNRLLSVRQSLGCLFISFCLITGSHAVQADVLPQSGALSAALPPTQVWNERAKELIRRMYQQLGGIPSELDEKPLKTSALMLEAKYTLFGLPPGLTADALAQLERDAHELADCAEWEPGPPDGTSYSLIVLMHDIGKAVHAAAVAY